MGVFTPLKLANATNQSVCTHTHPFLTIASLRTSQQKVGGGKREDFPRNSKGLPMAGLIKRGHCLCGIKAEGML